MELCVYLTTLDLHAVKSHLIKTTIYSIKYLFTCPGIFRLPLVLAPVLALVGSLA